MATKIPHKDANVEKNFILCVFRLFQLVPWQCFDGLQRDGQIHDQVSEAVGLRPVRSGRGSVALYLAFATGLEGRILGCQ